mgnify:CR=1 FL=1
MQPAPVLRHLLGPLGLGLLLLWPLSAAAEVAEAFEAPILEGEAPGDPFGADEAGEVGDEAGEGEVGDEAPGPFTALTPPPLLRVEPGEVVDLSAIYGQRFRFRMNMAYGAAGLTAAGILPFSLAVALHEIWPCGGRECINVTTVMGLSGLAGLSLFLVGAGAMAHWSTSATHALFEAKAPFRAIWMGRVSFILWAISEVLLTVAIVAPGAGLFWAGTLFGLASLPFAIGQLVFATLRHRDRDPGVTVAGRGVGTFPLLRWSLSP